MTGQPRSTRITVGVDGSPAALSAVNWAIREAVRRGLDLHLISAAWVDPFGYAAAAGVLPTLVSASLGVAEHALKHAQGFAAGIVSEVKAGSPLLMPGQ